MGKKYELTTETIVEHGNNLYRIRALRSFGTVKVGDLGGYIQSEDNLSHDGTCWISENAKVCDNAYICGDAQISGFSTIYGKAHVSDSARVCDGSAGDSAWVSETAQLLENAHIWGCATISENATICGNTTVCGNAWIYGDAYVGGDDLIHIRGNVKIDRGIWTHWVKIEYTIYLVSPTLEKILAE